VLTGFGKIVLKKSHTLANGTSKFGISQRMQELFCLVGQSLVYEEGCELFASLMGVDTSASQIQRVCLHYGEAIDTLVSSNCEAVIPRLESHKSEDALYIMMDGSMLYTRDSEWKELKLGRIFYDSQVVDIHKNRAEIMDSVYVSHLGRWCKVDMELGRR